MQGLGCLVMAGGIVVLQHNVYNGMPHVSRAALEHQRGPLQEANQGPLLDASETQLGLVDPPPLPAGRREALRTSEHDMGPGNRGHGGRLDARRSRDEGIGDYFRWLARLGVDVAVLSELNGANGLGCGGAVHSASMLAQPSLRMNGVLSRLLASSSRTILAGA